MTELTLDAYMQKIIDIETASTDANTTTAQLTILINELNALDTQLDTEIDNMVDTPVDFRYMRKIILVEIERSRKSNLQSSMEKLCDLRKQNLSTVIETQGNEASVNYLEETQNLINYKNTIVNSCNCMSQRQYLIENVSSNTNGNIPTQAQGNRP